MENQAEVGESWVFCLILRLPMGILFREKLEKGRQSLCKRFEMFSTGSCVWTPDLQMVMLFGRLWNLQEMGPIWREWGTSLGSHSLRSLLPTPQRYEARGDPVLHYHSHELHYVFSAIMNYILSNYLPLQIFPPLLMSDIWSQQHKKKNEDILQEAVTSSLSISGLMIKQ